MSTREREDDETAQRLITLSRVGLPVAVVLAAIAGGFLRGPPMLVLILAGGTLAAVVAFFWQSVRTLVGETPITGADAFALGSPRAEEERKRAVLRALKDLEFERSVGKISEADYQQLVATYRGEAKRLLQKLDEAAQPRRDRVMALVESRLRAAGLEGGLEEVRRTEPATKIEDADAPTSDPSPEAEPKAEPSSEPEAAPSAKPEPIASADEPDADATKKERTDAP